ncbi:MAG TPA: hypothetical protein VFT39_18580 [Vicinamibacterales bacterium]|nr:hypothetical protein [Vicinamibacterales bacterium]
MHTKLIRLIVAGEHSIFRHGLRRLLESEPGFVIVREVADGAAAIPMVLYAQKGQIELQPVEENGRPGVLVIARDEGPGISDVLRAAIDAPSDGTGVMGLRAMKRLVDEFEIESRAGQGTRVAVKKWKA